MGVGAVVVVGGLSHTLATVSETARMVGFHTRVEGCERVVRTTTVWARRVTETNSTLVAIDVVWDDDAAAVDPAALADFLASLRRSIPHDVAQ